MTRQDRDLELQRAREASDPAPEEQLLADGYEGEDPAPWDRRERTRAAPLRVPLRSAARLSPA